jgi:hypothetical protein
LPPSRELEKRWQEEIQRLKEVDRSSKEAEEAGYTARGGRFLFRGPYFLSYSFADNWRPS